MSLGADIACEWIWDRAFARAVDHVSSERFGIPPNVLLEMAGRAVADVVLAMTDTAEAQIGVLIGSGHNGGDGLVAARWLAEAGRDVAVYLVSASGEAQLSPLLAQQLHIYRATGRNVEHYRPGSLAGHKHRRQLIIDAVCGLGWRGPLAEDGLAFQALSEAAALRDHKAVAIDIPSGLDVDSGHAAQVPLPAAVTVTFGGKKAAHVLAPARDACGEVVVAAIGFPAAAIAAALAEHNLSFSVPAGRDLVRANPWDKLPRSANKYDRGHVLVLGGSAGKTGAPLLAAVAALRCGAGWVSIAMPEAALATLHGEVPRELVFEPLFRGDEIDCASLSRCLHERRVRAVVIGPGCLRSPLTAAVVAELVAFTSHGKGLVVLDAGAVHGALALLTGAELHADRWLLTPHPGEWQKLGPTAPLAPLTPEAWRETRGLAQRLGVTLLYKSATPVTVTGDLQLPAPAYVCTDGTLALARAGSGDLLAGAAGAHGAIGMTATLAALRAQTVIARAAKLAAAERGEHAVLAQDILAQLGKVEA